MKWDEIVFTVILYLVIGVLTSVLTYKPLKALEEDKETSIMLSSGIGALWPMALLICIVSSPFLLIKWLTKVLVK